MQFIDDGLIPGGGGVGIVGELRVTRCDEAGSAASSKRTAVRIDMSEKCSGGGVGDQEIVELADGDAGLIDAPIAVSFGEEMRARLPVVEIVLDLNVGGKGSPNAKRYAAGIRCSAHVGASGRWHVSFLGVAGSIEILDAGSISAEYVIGSSALK